MKYYFYFLLGKLSFFYHVWLNRAYGFLFGNDLRGDVMQSGELVVTGKDKVELQLGHRHPDSVSVKFKGGHAHVPCNPKHHDELRWEIKTHHSHEHHHTEYVLVISWYVTDVRTIEWVAYY
jgi:hypothetical protein